MSDLTKNSKEIYCSSSHSESTPKDDFVEIEVASLRDIPLHVRHREASKPLYLKRYE